MYLTFAILMLSVSIYGQKNQTVISGTVQREDGGGVEFASISLKNSTYGTSTDEDGNYLFAVPAGNQTILISALGYKSIERKVTIKEGVTNISNFVIATDATTLNEILVTGKTVVQKVNESAYNVVAIDAKQLYNSTLDLSHALDRISGVRVRESGGVGSSYNFSLNGFSGRQIKFFIDGIPMENFGSSFQINNIPINLA